MSDEIPLIPSVPQGLREAAQRGTLVPFVGAGASVLAGCPTWGQLADGALKACIAENRFSHGQLDQIRSLGSRMKLSIARAVEAEHRLKIDYDRLINPAKGYQNNDVGQRVYRSLGKLSRIFVTTNYDAWLDTEISDVSLSVSESQPAQDTASPPRVRRRIVNVEEFTPANLNQPDSVFHLHGSLSDPSSMVMTTYVDKRTHEASRQARQKSKAFASIVRRIEKSSEYSTIAAQMSSEAGISSHA